MLLLSTVSKKIGSSRAPYIVGLVLVGLIFMLSFLGALAVAAFGIFDDNDDWWYDGACFVGNISPLVIAVFLIVALVGSGKSRKDASEE